MADIVDSSSPHDIFERDKNEDKNTSSSSKDSEPENIDKIQKFIDEQHHNLKPDKDNVEAELSVLSLTNEQTENMNGVVSMMLTEPETGPTDADIKDNIPGKEIEKCTIALTVGSKVEARDFADIWYPGEIAEVDYDEMEVLVHYENTFNKHDEWINVSSSRLRPYIPKPENCSNLPEMASTKGSHDENTIQKDESNVEENNKVTFMPGERCLARWRDNRRFMATINKELENGEFEIVFDDGFHWKCASSRLYKLKDPSLSVDTSTSTSVSALSPIPAGTGPMGTQGLNVPYHTHLFDPTRDYLSSKSERREMKRKLNIKEIFNIGQKKRKIVSNFEKEKGNAETKPKVIKKQTKKKIESEMEINKKTVAKIHDNQQTTTNSTDINNTSETAMIEDCDKINLRDLDIASGDDDKMHTSYLSDSSDLNSSTDPVTKEEECLKRFEKPDEIKHEEEIVKIREAIMRLESSLNTTDSDNIKIKQEFVKVESFDVDTLTDNIKVESLEQSEVDLEKVEITLEKVETPFDHVAINVETYKKQANEISPEQLIEMQSSNIEVVKVDLGKPKLKKESLKLKKSKNMRLMREKNVKREFERVQSELMEVKRQMEEMRQQMLLKTESIAQSGGTKEMAESFLLPGEWCCKWVDGEPVGKVRDSADNKHDDKVPTLPRRSVEVEDKRLPVGWKKLLVRRSLGQSAGKWDVVLVAPDNKKIHTKHEMRLYLESNMDDALKPYEPALLDFSVHQKLSRRLGWVTYSQGNEKPSMPYRKRKLSLVRDGRSKQKLNIRKPKAFCTQPGDEPSNTNMYGSGTMDNTATTTLEDGYVYVGSLKVQVKDNLLCCPTEGCFKNFRSSALLKMHIKHYHRELKVMLGKAPKVVDLAYARSKATLKDRKKKKGERVIKVKLPKQKRSEEKFNFKDINKELKRNIIQQENNIHKIGDSPKLRQALVPRPVKGPKVLLPVRKVKSRVEKNMENELTNDETSANDMSEIDFETAISTHTVTKTLQSFKNDRNRLFSKAAVSEDDEWAAANSDFESRSSYLGSETPDFRTNKKIVPHQFGSSESNEEHKDSEMYMYTETGEKVKIERMKREEIINCHCGFREEDGLMVQCELCLCWQHALCHNIQREAEVPEKYTCSICLNPRRGRRSQRFVHDQDRLYEGLLPGAAPSDSARRSHELSANLLRLQDALHACRLKYYVASKKNHPKLYLWAKDWDSTELNLTKDRLNSDYSDLNVIINNIGKENMPLKTGFDHEDLPLTTELERMSNGQGVCGPQPEAAIENSACRERLLQHVQRCQALVDARLDSIEAQVAELESQDPSFEDDETADFYPRTKQTIQMLMRDLDTMEELAVIT
ncbi:uncharacterized protein LOC126965840 isoform X2 [Leptidea sinapis]|nr:uncharacterized protein LOC126965840 isoform X2 [Leptidea sinapis]XP_050665560.1 uncharacterized protein LOC126965840 isoform X2 [Leptidea sinapis]